MTIKNQAKPLTTTAHAPISIRCPNCGHEVSNVAQSADFGAYVPMNDDYMRQLESCSKEWGVRVENGKLPTDAQFKAARWKLGGVVKGAIAPSDPPLKNWQLYGYPIKDEQARRWIICKGDGFIHYHTGLDERNKRGLTGRTVSFLWIQSTDCRKLEASAKN